MPKVIDDINRVMTPALAFLVGIVLSMLIYCITLERYAECSFFITTLIILVALMCLAYKYTIREVLEDD